MNPEFSVIIPTHNGADRIAEAIRSVTEQTFTDYELIIVCDSCGDNTRERAEELTENIRDRRKIIDVGCRRDGLARNVGLTIADGKWILFLDDDDRFLHEYCFEMLAEKLDECGADVLDFSFIWKGVGYKDPSPDEQFVMAWCRAWRRSFIGDNRFNSEPYGSDKDFYIRMIRDNPKVTVAFWHCPMYYYNYMREGSLSWMEKKKTILDIIITHCGEPWELGKPLFDSLQMQRCADLSNVCITLVQDGDDGDMEWDYRFLSYNGFPVNVIRVNKCGVAEARNKALEKTNSPWVMFMNFDDFLGDACSLAMMLENFPNDDYDVVWMKMVQEMKWYTGSIYMNKIDGVSFATVSGKMYRRELLMKHNIRFPKAPLYYYDQMFNALVLAHASPFRIAALTTDFYPYFKTFRPDSTRHTKEAFLYAMNSASRRDMAIAEQLRKRGFEHEYARTALKAVLREYNAVYNPDEAEPEHYSDNLVNFYRIHRENVMKLPETEWDPVREEVEAEVMNLIQQFYNEHKKEYYLLNDNVPLEQWLDGLNMIVDAVPAPALQDIVVDMPKKQETPVPDILGIDDSERVVVYCGTYDVYLNMIASVKSLLCNTPVDRVYFLIEDDVFPYELPDIVHTVNVKPLAFETFDRSGPNFNNSWTWMCMVRALYPEMFPQYGKILSLDIDIVVNDNVSDLWDYDLTDYYIAGVPERQRQKTSSDPLYVNFGVIMMNLDALRRDHKQEEIVNTLNTRKVDCPEQGAYNRACANHILALPADYNYTTYSHITGDAAKQRVIHYAGQKFWRHYRLVRKYSELGWDEVMARQNSLKEDAQ